MRACYSIWGNPLIRPEKLAILLDSISFFICERPFRLSFLAVYIKLNSKNNKEHLGKISDIYILLKAKFIGLNLFRTARNPG